MFFPRAKGDLLQYFLCIGEGHPNLDPNLDHPSLGVTIPRVDPTPAMVAVTGGTGSFPPATAC